MGPRVLQPWLSTPHGTPQTTMLKHRATLYASACQCDELRLFVLPPSDTTDHHHLDPKSALVSAYAITFEPAAPERGRRIAPLALLLLDHFGRHHLEIG